MATLESIAMSGSKDELLKRLDLPLETYTMMAKETNLVYIWLTSEKAHLKKNCKREPPYDWSDMQEKSKDEAIRRIAERGDQYTSNYWRLAKPYADCPNWIARWFLYHKFRYRDGRNRASAKDSGKRHQEQKGGSPSKHHHKHSSGDKGTYDYSYSGQKGYYQEASTISEAATSIPATASSSSGYGYDQTQYDGAAPVCNDNQVPGTYYDPVRDV